MTDREYLFSLEQIGIKLGLDQITRLLLALDHPDRAFPSIIVAGTNGKGSVTAMVERGLRAAGYQTGRYISPHLTSIEERVAINGLAISADTFDQLAARVREAAATLPFPPSFFEATTALALLAFRDAAVDIAVLEVGLGGRLDATNAVTPVLSVITAIDMDHQQYLGDTIELIATEKAGIIKPGVPVVLGHNSETVRGVIREVAAERGATLVYAPDDVGVRPTLSNGVTTLGLTTPLGEMTAVPLALRGRHQIDNAITAVRVLETLGESGRFVIPASARRSALARVAWPARLEMRQWRAPGGLVSVLVDGAHNPAGAEALAQYLREAFGRPLPVIFAAMKDKDIDGIVRALSSVASIVVCTRVQSARATLPGDLAQRVSAMAPDLTVIAAETPAAALAVAAPMGEPVVVAGSLYLAGEIRELLS